MSLHPTIATFEKLVSEIRLRLAQENCSEYTSIQLQAAGYPLHGDFEIKFYIGDTQKGLYHLDPRQALDEFLRRKTYDKNASTLLLRSDAKVEQPPSEDETPF